MKFGYQSVCIMYLFIYILILFLEKAPPSLLSSDFKPETNNYK